MPRLKGRDLRQCKKFSTYILGRPFVVESDHKPLAPLLNTKQVDNLPKIFRFCLRLAKYDYIAEHVPEKLLYAADVLSRASIQGESEEELQEEVEVYVNHITVIHTCYNSPIAGLLTSTSGGC